MSFTTADILAAGPNHSQPGSNRYGSVPYTIPRWLQAGGLFSDWVIGNFGVPMGVPRLPPLHLPDLGLLGVAGPATSGTKVALPEEIDRRDKALSQKPSQEPGNVSTAPITDPTGRLFSNARQQEMVAYGWTWKDGVWTYQGTTPQPTTTASKSMDLGSIITELGTAYIQNRYAPSVQTVGASPTTVQPAYDLFDAGSDVIDFFTAPDGTIVPVKKKKKCRRRRRRLATVSDIADLASLKAVLGNGDAFKTWIATHSR